MRTSILPLNSQTRLMYPFSTDVYNIAYFPFQPYMRCSRKGNILRESKGRALQLAVSSDERICCCVVSLFMVYIIYVIGGECDRGCLSSLFGGGSEEEIGEKAEEGQEESSQVSLSLLFVHGLYLRFSVPVNKRWSMSLYSSPRLPART
jgi:hypothetical protein